MRRVHKLRVSIAILSIGITCAASALAEDEIATNSLPARAERFLKASEAFRAKKLEEFEKEIPRIRRAAIVPSLKQRNIREIQAEQKKFTDKKFLPTPVLDKRPAVGDIGVLPRTKGIVREILGDHELIVGVPEFETLLRARGPQLEQSFREVETYHCVKGIPTEGKLPRDEVELSQTFEVVSRREWDAPRETVTIPIMEILDEEAIREFLKENAPARKR